MAPDCLPHQVRCHVEAGADCPAYYVDVYYEQPAVAACEGPAAEAAAEAEGAHEAVDAHEGGAWDGAGRGAGPGASGPGRRGAAAALAHVVSFSWSGDG